MQKALVNFDGGANRGRPGVRIVSPDGAKLDAPATLARGKLR